MKILFLDDDHERHDSFERLHPYDDVVHAFTFAQFKEAIVRDYFDVMHLDHDLNDFAPYDDNEYRYEFTGVDAANHINTLPDETQPTAVIIHSHNPDGAGLMYHILADNSRGRLVRLEPFEFRGK